MPLNTDAIRKGEAMSDLQKPLIQFGILAAVLLLGLAGSAPAAQVAWHNDFRAAAQESNRLNKPMLVKVTAEWCGYCKKMKRSFADQRVARHLKACFIPVIVDADTDVQLVQAIGVESLPTTVIISPEMKIIEKITGFRTPAQLDQDLGKVCNRNKNHEPHTRTDEIGPGRPPAFDGYCLVTLLDDMALSKGSMEHTTVYRGVTLAFASAAHQASFESHPEMYWPALDGHCPVSARELGTQRPGVPRLTAIYRGRIYFFADARSRQKFAQSPDEYTRLANRRAGA